MTTEDPNSVDVDTSADQDQFKQIKGEMNRKFEKQSEQIQALMKQNGDLLAAIQAAQSRTAASAQPAEEASLEDLMLSDPKRAAAMIRESAVREAEERIGGKLAAQNSINQTIASLNVEYPELSDQNSELVKSTLKVLESIPAERRDATTYEYAVQKAANQLDIRPRSKRPETDEFMPATAGSAAARRRTRSDSQLVEQSRDMAKAFGVNIEDKKLKEAYLKLAKERGIK